MSKTEKIVLVHGLWMRGFVMAVLANRLKRYGFQVHLFSYPSTVADVDANAAGLNRFVHGEDAGKLHFVGHSLGGLVVCRMLQAYRFADVGRVVLLGTPLAGSDAARRMAASRLGKIMLGRSLPVLSSGCALPAGGFEVGVIAGNMNIGAGLLTGGVRGPGDGMVSVSETRPAWISDHVTVHTTHTGLLFSGQVARQISAFIRDGKFLRESRDAI